MSYNNKGLKCLSLVCTSDASNERKHNCDLAKRTNFNPCVCACRKHKNKHQNAMRLCFCLSRSRFHGEIRVVILALVLALVLVLASLVKTRLYVIDGYL